MNYFDNLFELVYFKTKIIDSVTWIGYKGRHFRNLICFESNRNCKKNVKELKL